MNFLLVLLNFLFQVIINCGALPCLLQLLSAPKESIRKEVGARQIAIKLANPIFYRVFFVLLI